MKYRKLFHPRRNQTAGSHIANVAQRFKHLVQYVSSSAVLYFTVLDAGSLSVTSPTVFVHSSLPLLYCSLSLSWLYTVVKCVFDAATPAVGRTNLLKEEALAFDSAIKALARRFKTGEAAIKLANVLAPSTVR